LNHQGKRHNAIVVSHPLSDKASLSGIRRRLRADFSRLEIDPAMSFDCLVAVTEACTNALVHGMRDMHGPTPKLSWQIDAERARFYVQDYSNQRWSMAAHPSKGFEEMSAEDFERRVGGFGLPIMRDLMDHVDIEIGARGTTVVLTKHFR
jgi:anti-sigma regulatory factor (Ser/Thr protein kinase)